MTAITAPLSDVLDASEAAAMLRVQPETRKSKAIPRWRPSKYPDALERALAWIDHLEAVKRWEREKSRPVLTPSQKQIIATERRAARQAYARAREIAKSNQTPAWADRRAMARIYVEAARLTRQTGEPREVDHIVPLRAFLASGLHCEFNLQIIPRAENRAKCNAFEIE